MFAQPKPILPGVEDDELAAASTADGASPTKAATAASGIEITTTPEGGGPPKVAQQKSAVGNMTSPVAVGLAATMPPVLKIETAWERGLRQAKEMKKRSQQRKVLNTPNNIPTHI